MCIAQIVLVEEKRRLIDDNAALCGQISLLEGNLSQLQTQRDEDKLRARDYEAY